jgi:hypothetical protein
MADAYFWIGSTGPFIYNDEDEYSDTPGLLLRGLRCPQVLLSLAASEDQHAVRKLELDALIDITSLPDGAVLFESSDTISGDADFTYDPATDTLDVSRLLVRPNATFVTLTDIVANVNTGVLPSGIFIYTKTTAGDEKLTAAFGPDGQAFFSGATERLSVGASGIEVTGAVDIDDSNTRITKDGSDMTLTDAVAGTKKLNDLLAVSESVGGVQYLTLNNGSVNVYIWANSTGDGIEVSTTPPA